MTLGTADLYNSINKLEADNKRLTVELDKAHLLLSQSIGWQRDAEIVKAKQGQEIEQLSGVIKANKLCDPRYCTFGNENEIERLKADNVKLAEDNMLLRLLIDGYQRIKP